jgi:hypothetical protein
MFRIGARIVAVPAKNGALDALRGTQHLLTQAGRDILAAQYQAGYVAGAQAVVTKLDTTVAFLEKNALWDDMERANDISYYEVGQGTFEGKYATQGKGYRHCIPRIDVSVGEKERFAHLLGQLAVTSVKSGRDAAKVTDGLVGASATYSGDDECLARQLVAAASESPDFFAVEGCATAADVERVAMVLEANKRREVMLKTTDGRGFEIPDEHPTPMGFDIPAMIIASVPPSHADFESLALAAAADPRVVCLGTPTAVGQADCDKLLPLLQGTALAGAAEAEGEIAILG